MKFFCKNGNFFCKNGNFFVKMEVFWSFFVQMEVFFIFVRCPRVFWKHGILMEGMMKVLVKVIANDKDCCEILPLMLNEFKPINWLLFLRGGKPINLLKHA